MNSFNWVIESIKDRLHRNELYGEEDILKQITFLRAVLEQEDNPIREGFIHGHDYQPLSENDWKRVRANLLSTFATAYEFGLGLQGEEQKNRNTSWWADDFDKEENYYWDRFAAHMEKKRPNSSKVLDHDSTFIVNNIGNPNKEAKFSIFGMVVGHVQSGKTESFSSVINKAADAGYKAIFVISGDKNNLRRQTQERIYELFVGRSPEVDPNDPSPNSRSIKKIGVGYISDKDDSVPAAYTNLENDYSANSRTLTEAFNFEQFKVPVILVIKKNKSILENLIKHLNNQKLIKSVPTLIIDDEADYASINTNDDIDDPTTINRLIRELAASSDKSSYVAYTATPFANIFIDHKANDVEFGKDLFPKDFIWALRAPSSYFGAKQIDENPDLYLKEIKIKDLEALPLKHKKDDPLMKLPDSLYDAIRWFYLSVVLRNLMGQSSENKSMLIHISRFTQKHQEITGLVREYQVALRKNIEAYINTSGHSNAYLEQLKDTFDREYIQKINKPEFNWEDIKPHLVKAIKSVKIREVHKDTTEPLEYSDRDPASYIVIGGMSLSRGFTIKGITVSYFLRNSKFYDTLMQMARWYGYMTGYQELVRIYMTKTMSRYFIHIHHATNELMDKFASMSRQNKTPEQFGLEVRDHPENALKVTAVQKMRNAETKYVQIKLEGNLKDLYRLSNKEEDLSHNLDLFKNFTTNLQLNSKAETPHGKNNYLWRDVSNQLIKDFLLDYRTYGSNGFAIETGMPIDLVTQFVERNSNWDVALFGGKGETVSWGNGLEVHHEQRIIRNEDENYYYINQRNLTNQSQEAIAITGDLYKEASLKREVAREAPGRNNLLMLHLVESSDNSDDGYRDVRELACFGISFSENFNATTENRAYVINRVMQEEIEEAYKAERSSVEE